jgi:myo-inositol-1(or 4)-monophosphatase
MNHDTERKAATEAARKAGGLLRDRMALDQEILSEQGKDIKLQADRDAEAVILESLAKTGHPALAEESGAHGLVAGDAPYWVVDPLDGTLNFSRGLPICCVSIALCRGDEPVLGVIYDFNRDELFEGIPGEGAWCNGKPIRVSNIRERSRAVLATGFPTRFDLSDDSVMGFVRGVQGFKKVRLLGSAAIMLAYVACGRVDAYSEDRIMLWDVAAGVALTRAAGGHVSMNEAPGDPWARMVRCAAHACLWEG